MGGERLDGSYSILVTAVGIKVAMIQIIIPFFHLIKYSHGGSATTALLCVKFLMRKADVNESSKAEFRYVGVLTGISLSLCDCGREMEEK